VCPEREEAVQGVIAAPGPAARSVAADHPSGRGVTSVHGRRDFRPPIGGRSLLFMNGARRRRQTRGQALRPGPVRSLCGPEPSLFVAVFSTAPCSYPGLVARHVYQSVDMAPLSLPPRRTVEGCWTCRRDCQRVAEFVWPAWRRVLSWRMGRTLRSRESGCHAYALVGM
jgi:hypothetical protein